MRDGFTHWPGTHGLGRGARSLCRLCRLFGRIDDVPLGRWEWRDRMDKEKAFRLPEEDRERLRRGEMILAQQVMVLASQAEFAREDLRKRMEMVPDGVARLDAACDGISELFQDMMGTVPEKQRRQMLNTARDYVMVFQPKAMPGNPRISLANEDFRELVELARYRCQTCADTAEEAKKCPLYRWMEANIPLEDYGDGLVCPYYTIGWK